MLLKRPSKRYYITHLWLFDIISWQVPCRLIFGYVSDLYNNMCPLLKPCYLLKFWLCWRSNILLNILTSISCCLYLLFWPMLTLLNQNSWNHPLIVDPRVDVIVYHLTRRRYLISLPSEKLECSKGNNNERCQTNTCFVLPFQSRPLYTLVYSKIFNNRNNKILTKVTDMNN